MNINAPAAAASADTQLSRNDAPLTPIWDEDGNGIGVLEFFGNQRGPWHPVMPGWFLPCYTLQEQATDALKRYTWTRGEFAPTMNDMR